MKRKDPIDKIIDELQKEFAKLDLPIMDKMTIFAKTQNAIYQVEEATQTELSNRIIKKMWNWRTAKCENIDKVAMETIVLKELNRGT